MFDRLFGSFAALSLVSLVILGAGQTVVDAKSVGDHQLIAAKKPNLATNDPQVIMETSKGTIRIVVYRKDVPITGGNFLDLVSKGFYNGLSFHRYEPGFALFGGDPRGDGTGTYVDPQTHSERKIPLEIKPAFRHSDAGIVAMARSSDPNSGSCQFYITIAAAPKLDGEYAVFGKVIDGMSTVMSLRKGDKIVHAEVKEPGGK